jgi:glycosyltransferase involved in cell wall biosynthesis
MISVLYDGWPLIYEPESLSALHLWTLFANISPEVSPIVALPASPPPWLSEISTHIHEVPNNSWSKMIWQQKILPDLTRRLNIQILHLATKDIPFFKADISVVSPAVYDFLPADSFNRPANRDRGLRDLTNRGSNPIMERIREALSQGGLVRVHTILWPDDIPKPDPYPSITVLPPVIHPNFLLRIPDFPANGFNSSEISLPDDYILYHGPFDLSSIYRLLNTWRWAAGSIGNQVPLLLLGLDQKRRALVKPILKKTDFSDTIHLVANVPPPAIPFIYQNCSALIHPTGVSPWDGPLRFAMACGKPVVSLEIPMVKAITGPAGYLAPIDDDRSLGAAIISIIVDEELRARLAKAAKDRSTEWFKKDFSQSLLVAYQRLIGKD